jgi:hypothetical protein
MYVENLRTAKATDHFILAGGDGSGGVEEYQPQFTYHGFRYVEISGIAAEPDHRSDLDCGAHLRLARLAAKHLVNRSTLASSHFWRRQGEPQANGSGPLGCEGEGRGRSAR